MNWLLLLKPLGLLLIILGVMLGVPAMHAFKHASYCFESLLVSSLIGILLGTLFLYSSRKVEGEFSNRMGFAVVTISWIFACFLGALPYYFSHALPNFVDAFFESASGFSGTGASVLTDIEATDKSLLFWRSLTQWLGGMGIIVFFIAILPLLGIGGVQLFRAETTGIQKDKITPRVRDTAKSLWLLYFGFTLILTLLLCWNGLSLYDAVNHAMTTMSTGGFSTRNLGVASFNNKNVDYLIAIFMMIGSINFGLHYRFLVFRDVQAFFDTELKGYLAITSCAIALTTGAIWINNFSSLEEAFRHAFFTIAATSSSTGFTHSNYLLWPVFTHYILILLMVMGGMSGSTAGGCKCVRLIAAFKLLAKELKQVIHPNAVLTVKTNDKSIRQNVSSAIWGFLFLYMFTFSIISAILIFEGLDLVSGCTATFSALSNIGPAFGSLGPLDNYAHLNYASKLALCAGMVMGRLEFFTVIVIFLPEYWRK